MFGRNYMTSLIGPRAQVRSTLIFRSAYITEGTHYLHVSRNCYVSSLRCFVSSYVCLLITLTRSPKAELGRAQLNGIGRMHMKGASGSWMVPEHSSQARCFWLGQRPDHNTGNSVPYTLRIVCGLFNVPQLFTTSFVRRDLRLIVLIRENLQV